MDVDLPRAAESIEVVDVDAAQVGLQRVEHVAEGHADRLAFDTVDVHVELRCAGAEGWEDADKARLLVGPRCEVVGLTLQGFQTVVAAVLDHELEAAGRAESVNRRGSEYADQGLLDLAPQTCSQFARNAVRPELRIVAVLEVFENDEH